MGAHNNIATNLTKLTRRHFSQCTVYVSDVTAQRRIMSTVSLLLSRLSNVTQRLRLTCHVVSGSAFIQGLEQSRRVTPSIRLSPFAHFDT